jgi:competence protein ComEA
MNSVLRAFVYALLGLCCTVPARTLAQESEAAAPAHGGVSSETAAAAAHGVVNINTATADELERLPSIGPARARAILELRAKLTRFATIDQLLRVKGIGRATFRKLRPLLTLSGPTTLRER